MTVLLQIMDCQSNNGTTVVSASSLVFLRLEDRVNALPCVQPPQLLLRIVYYQKGIFTATLNVNKPIDRWRIQNHDNPWETVAFFHLFFAIFRYIKIDLIQGGQPGYNRGAKMHMIYMIFCLCFH